MRCSSGSAVYRRLKQPALFARWPLVRVVITLVIVLVIIAAIFAMPSRSHEYRCFLPCHGKSEIEIGAIGWPAAYSSYEIVPGDPPRVGPAHLDPVAIVLDVIVLGLLLCGFGIAMSAVRRPARLHTELCAALRRSSVRPPR